MKLLYNGLLLLAAVYFYSMFEYQGAGPSIYLIGAFITVGLVILINGVNGLIFSLILSAMGCFFLAIYLDRFQPGFAGLFFLIAAYAAFKALK